MGKRQMMRIGLVLSLLGALGACVEPGDPVRPPASSGEVEAPSAFSREEPGLWDGRPSLGGVWVAHPSARTPRRVIIRNTENGKSVAGALFRRERDMPGTRLQVSSEAAEALGMLAGAPAKLSVVALERVEPAAQEPPAADKRPVAKPTNADAPATKAKPPARTEKPAPAVASEGTAVQIGIFGVEANARAAQAKLAAAEVPGMIRKHQSGQRIYWSVVAGPAQSPEDTELLLKKVRALGYSDAYAITK